MDSLSLRGLHWPYERSRGDDHERSDAGNHPGARRHRQDRPAGGGAAAGARRAGARRLALRASRRSTGTTSATWAPALRGVRRRRTSPSTPTSRSRAPPRRSARSPRRLSSSGVRRLVLLSGRGEEEAQRAEQAVRDAGADWTIVRCSWFSQNFSESFLLEPVLAGEVALPVGRRPGAVRRRRGHRRRRGRRADRGRARGPALRADRSAPADLRRRGRRRSRARPAGRCATCRSRSRQFASATGRAGSPGDVVDC